jgi:hypothetical protein
MTKTKQLEIANYCYAFASGMFAEFHNPNMRGDKFTWTNFPSMVERLARAQVFTSVSMTKKTQVEIEDKAAEYAKEIANTLIKRAGYI